MSEATAKPYLLRALYEWCSAQGYTPHLAVKVDSKTRVPAAYVRDGEITLNISESATQKLTMDNEWVLFNARFNGASQEVAVPMAAVMGIYARETGYGMGFAVESIVSVIPDKASQDDGKLGEKPNPGDGAPKPTRPRSHLSVIK